MRIPSGVTDQYIYFVAVDATDFTTRETGLSSFTVYRSRNGAAAAAMTTPTINETDSSNMPGVYELLLDEDMTIGAGNDSEEMVFHITHAGMAPVTRTIELYRPKITAGQTLTVTSGVASANALQISGDSSAADSLEAALDGTGGVTITAAITGNITGNLSGSVGSVTGNVGGNVTGSVASVTGNVGGNVTGSVGSVTGGINTGSGTITTLDALDTAQDSQHSATQSAISGLSIPSAGAIADAVLDEALSGHSTAGTLGKAIADTESDATAILADTNELQTNQGNWLTATGFSTHSAADVWSVATRVLTANTNLNDPTAAAIADAVLDEALSGHTTIGSLGKAVADIETDATAILADTNELQTNQGNWATATGFSTHSAADVRTEMDSNSTQLAAIVADTNELQTNQGNWLTATGFSTHSAADVWSVATRVLTANTNLNDPTAAAIADAVLDEALSGHSTAGSLGKAITDIETDVDAVLVDTGTTLPATLSGLNDVSVSDIWTTQLTESYAADGSAPTGTQALMLIQQALTEFAYSGTSFTVKKLDGSTTAAVMTLDDGTSPTSSTRSS